MVAIALGLMVIAVVLTALNTAAGRWGMQHRRWPPGAGPTYEEWLTYAGRYETREEMAVVLGACSSSPCGGLVPDPVIAAWRAVLSQSDVLVFSQVLFSVYVSFLLPLWCLSFATEALGSEREAGSMVWLLTRPLPRPLIYLAKFLALLPWSLGLNLGGFALVCLAAGPPGFVALRLYWPAVFWATLAFSALFYLIGAVFRWPAVVAIVYSFFLETILGNMPGYLKRVSISFYTRCMMYDVAQAYGVQPEKPSVYLPVDGTTAWLVLLGVTGALLLIGMVYFSRREYVSAA
jgi:ABC-type transport system involved in multi-copper enzyme maturation permease subunit